MLSDWTLPDAAVSLVPLLCLPAFLLWRISRRSRRLVVRAAAGPLLSITIGLGALLAMVVGFSAFELDGRAVHAWREVLIRLREVTEAPAWVWIVSYLVLAGLGAARTLRPGLAKTGWRLVPGLSATVGRADTALSVLHTALMVVTLFALATPTIEPAARRQLRWQYRVALQEQVDAEGQFNAASFLRQALAHQPREARASFGDLIDRAGERTSEGERSAGLARLGVEHARAVLDALPLGDIPGDGLSRPLPEEIEFLAPLQGFADAERRLADVEAEQTRAKQDQDAVSPVVDNLARASTAAAVSLLAIPANDEYVAFGTSVGGDYLGALVEALSTGGFARIARLSHFPSQALAVQRLGVELSSLPVSVAPSPAEMDHVLPHLATGPALPLPNRASIPRDTSRIDEIVHERAEAELRDLDEGR